MWFKEEPSPVGKITLISFLELNFQLYTLYTVKNAMAIIKFPFSKFIKSTSPAVFEPRNQSCSFLTFYQAGSIVIFVTLVVIFVVTLQLSQELP